MNNDNTEKLSFFDPSDILLAESDLLPEASFDVASKVLSFHSDTMADVVFPISESNDLKDVSLDGTTLRLLTDLNEIIIPDLEWSDKYVLSNGANKGLLTANGFVPLTGNRGIIVTEHDDRVEIDYQGQAGQELLGYGYFSHPITLPSVGSNWMALTVSTNPSNRLRLPFTAVESSGEYAIGPNGGALLPAGSYFIHANATVVAAYRCTLELIDADGVLLLKSDGVYGFSNSSVTSVLPIQLIGMFSLTSPTEVNLSFYTNSRGVINTQVGWTNRVHANFPISSSGLNMAVFRLSDQALVNPMPTVAYKLPVSITANNTADYLITASSVFNNAVVHQPYNAFNDNTSIWAAQSSAGAWINLLLKNTTVECNTIAICGRYDGNYVGSPSEIKVEYRESDEGEWIVAGAAYTANSNHSAATTLFKFGQTVTIKELKITVLSGDATIGRIQLMDIY